MYPGVLLTGTIGAGKTALAAEIGKVCAAKGLPAAIIDVDWLGWTSMPYDPSLMWKNLTTVWPNYVAAGARYAVLARLVEHAEDVAALRRAVPEIDLKVVRIDVPPEIVEQRLRARDTGAVLEEHLAETVEFAAIASRLGVEDFVVTNTGDIHALAEEVVGRLGWI